jgi:sigma-B regulation protein RsbU (phosphoserine phosphatase)
MAMRYQAAFKEAEVGGDFYDIFELSDGRVGIVIGDVAGKGLSAAVHVAAAKHSIRSYAYLYDSPSRVMALTNDILCKAQIAEQSDTSFLTVFFVVIDTQHQMITYVNAGHEPPLVVNKNGIYDELESSGDLALGILGNQIYTEFNRALHQGDLVVAVTDGITEARQDVSKLFGKEGILDVLLHELKTPVEEIPIKLLDAARTYAGGELQDDAAIVAFTCNQS